MSDYLYDNLTCMLTFKPLKFFAIATRAQHAKQDQSNRFANTGTRSCYSIVV